jgi:hypothetical protein
MEHVWFYLPLKILIYTEYRRVLNNEDRTTQNRFTTYKGNLLGVPVEADNPAYSSRTCSICFFCDKKNRKSQSEFCCLSCGFATNADINAAKVLSQRERRANINKPTVTNSSSV